MRRRGDTPTGDGGVRPAERPPAYPARGGGLLDLVAQGDEAAFAQLYVSVQPRLHRYALSLVGQDADDVTAEAWLQIARDVRTFTGDEDAFRAWAARIVRNRAMDLLRQRARRPADLFAPDELPEKPSGDLTAEAALETLSTETAVALIAALPHEQAESVMLRVVVGLDAASAGEILGRTPTAVRVSAHRGLKRLARTLDEPEVKRSAPVRR